MGEGKGRKNGEERSGRGRGRGEGEKGEWKVTIRRFAEYQSNYFCTVLSLSGSHRQGASYRNENANEKGGVEGIGKSGNANRDGSIYNFGDFIYGCVYERFDKDICFTELVNKSIYFHQNQFIFRK